MECCETKDNKGCYEDSNKQEIKRGNFKMEKRTILWMAIGVIFLVALYFVFQAGSGSAISTVGSSASTSAGTASSMVGGC